MKKAKRLRDGASAISAFPRPGGAFLLKANDMMSRLPIPALACLAMGLLSASRPASLPAGRPATQPASRPATQRADYPTSAYTVRQVEGWKVYVHNDLLGPQKPLGDEVLKLLAAKLYDINRAVPPAALAHLYKVPIWIGVRDALGRFPCACYHPSPGWLREHGYNTDKVGAVEIANAATFIKWSQDQPSMVLHELTHGYHHQVLGYDNPEVRAAYKHAVETRIYESVLYLDGRTQRAYAVKDDQEYLAELTEAYFGVNDFYPFVRGEIKRHDPTMYDLLGKLWKK